MSVVAQNPELAEVPKDLLEQSDFLKRWHEWKSSAVVRGCVPLHRALSAPYASLPGILMYHRVVPVHDMPAGIAEPTWNVTPDRFRSQLSGLLDQGYQAWSLSRLLQVQQDGGEIPAHVFVVTFDDGYANNLIHAVPVLKELDITATVFLATAYIDSPGPFPFDDWSAKGDDRVHPDTWRALTSRECHLCLDSHVVEFGSHTHTHEDFRRRPEDFAESLQRSNEILRARFGVSRPALSLPYGIINRGFAGPTFYEAARKNGMTCCLTTEEELIAANSTPFGWGRFIAEQHDTADTIGVKLDGWRDFARNIWRRARGRSIRS